VDALDEKARKRYLALAVLLILLSPFF
jgi:hypothetical protein